MKNKYFSLMPIGGVQEIGSNMTLIRTEDEDIVIDCGMLFPYEECFDINYLIPDFSDLNPERFRTVIITHGHEDHIGSLPHLLKDFPNITVYASKFTVHLIQKKLDEFNIKMNYKIYDSQSEIRLGNITIFPVHVNHSIPETCGLVIRTNNLIWGALYISDFKVDLTSKHESPIDFQRIKDLLAVCHKKVFLLDSTNILNDGKTTSEVELLDDLRSLIERPEERVFITLFASNVHRMNAISKMAMAHGRKIVIMGRSLKTYMEAAFETGHSDIPPGDFYLPEQVKGQSGKFLVFLSGCQGDFLSALRRFSFGEDGSFKPAPGDLVIFSSKVIPGNEKKIFRIYNKLSEFGADIVTAYDHLIHASGHPGKEDLRELLKVIIPDFYFPIHGESYLLKKHYEFIKECYPQISTQLIFNYHEVILRDEGLIIEKRSEKEPRLIHGRGIEIERSQISQRRKMSTQGATFITYQRTSQLLEVTTVGLPLLAQSLLEKLKSRLSEQIQKDLQSRNENYVKDQLKISTRQFFKNHLGYKPVTEVHLC